MTIGRRILMIMVGLSVMAGGSLAQPKTLSFKAGDTEHWAFTMDGKSIGTMDAACSAVRTGANKQQLFDWKFSLKLNLPVQGQQVALSMTGTYTVTDHGNPTAVSLSANVNGQAQKLSGIFSGGKAKMTIQAGGQNMTPEVAITGKEFLAINNIISLFSIATRAVQVQPGKTVKAPFFAVEMMRGLDITFAAQARTETITVGGKKIECVVSDVSPIGARIHTSKATGEMLRYTMAAQKLVIERK